MQIDFRVIVDGQPGDPLARTFERYWPAYQKWMRRAAPIEPGAWARQLHQHMPELVGVHAELCARFGATDDIARFLALYNPPRVVRACTQLVTDAHPANAPDGDEHPGPRLIRSYDHHPRLLDRLVLKSRWGATDTLGVTDCLWGVLDGINDHGLAIALAFGGRNVTGQGFSAPLICRYVLETCATTAHARAALERLPVHMAYTFVVLDAAGAFVTAFLGPDRPAAFVTRRASANHQSAIDWPEYAHSVHSAERLACAESLVGPDTDIDAIRHAFLTPPLWRTDYERASGTLYVAEYTPHDRALALHWPAHSERLSIADATDRSFAVDLPTPTAIR